MRHKNLNIGTEKELLKAEADRAPFLVQLNRRS